ncbi:MAG: TIR domain-containing protein [Blastocatellales bacterium]
MKQEFEYDVYISYSSKDKPEVMELAKRLEGDGLRVWIDEWKLAAGDNWQQTIAEALQRSRVLIPVISANSVKSGWVEFEWGTALDKLLNDTRRRIIPVLLDDTRVPLPLEQFFHVDWRQRSESQYRRLLDACRNSEAETEPKKQAARKMPNNRTSKAKAERKNQSKSEKQDDPKKQEEAPSPQFWLVSINKHQCDWVPVSHNPGVKYSIQWRHSLDAGARENLKRARAGDVVLAYRPEAEHDSIAAIGAIKREVGPDDNEIEIELEIIFDQPISREQLVAVVPVVNYAPGVHFGLFNSIDAEKWSFIRELILSNNPSLSLSKWPAPSSVPRIPRADLVKVALSGEMVAGKLARANISIRNHSNFTWKRGDLFLISGTTDLEKPGRAYQGQIEWRAVIDRDIPVWNVWEASNLEFGVPEVYDEEFNLRFNLGFRLPYQDEESYWTKWEFPARQNTDEVPVEQTLTNQMAQQPLETTPSVSSQAASVSETPSQAASLPIQRPTPFAPAAPPAPLDLAPQVVIVQQRYEPLPDEIKINVRVSSKFVTLEYNDQQFNSPSRISQESLLELESGGKLREYGEELFKAIFNDEATLIGGQGKTTFRGYSAAVNDDDARGKVRLSVSLDQAALDGTEGTDLFDIWWEYLKDPLSDTPLSVSERAPFYRLQGKRPGPGAVDARPLKILVAICNPTTLGQAGGEVEKLTQLNVEQERDIVERALKRLKDAQVADYDIWHSESGDEPVTLFNLQQKLEEGYHVLHLISHGAYSRKLGGYALVMENDNREHEMVPAERFTAPLLTDKLRLIVLACCQSGDYKTGKALQALGPRLVHLGAPAVIAMQDFVPIATAQLFTQHFYDDLARSGRVDMAMAATRFALYSRDGGESREWAIPVLLMCNDDGKLFNVDPQKAARLEDLRPDVKTYNQLPGGDPTPRKLAQAVAAEARQLGADENTISSLRETVAAALRGATLRPESAPIAPQQDRQTLSDIIKQKVRINPKDLRQFVETRGSRLELADSVYQQVASALNTGKHVIFIGPPGTGKTSLAHDICAFAKEQGFTTGVTSATATADWSTFDTVGGYTPAQDQTLQFRPGIFLRAICETEWLVIDEINRAEIDKAFGELFTALSGQRVDLPYWVGEKQVRILPAEKDFDQWWDSGLGAKSYDYVMHPNWRIVAAMNAYDKSYLYAMSFAFMRRFAFIDIDVPGKDGYHALLERWMDEYGLPVLEETREPLRTALQKLIEAESELMRRRALGPAILRDIIRHIGDRRDHDNQADLCDLLCEAFLLHAAPQLDGIERIGIFGINRYLQELFAKQEMMLKALIARLRSLYPHITEKEWTDGQD